MCSKGSSINSFDQNPSRGHPFLKQHLGSSYQDCLSLQADCKIAGSFLSSIQNPQKRNPIAINLHLLHLKGGAGGQAARLRTRRRGRRNPIQEALSGRRPSERPSLAVVKPEAHAPPERRPRRKEGDRRPKWKKFLFQCFKRVSLNRTVFSRAPLISCPTLWLETPHQEANRSKRQQACGILHHTRRSGRVI